MEKHNAQIVQLTRWVLLFTNFLHNTRNIFQAFVHVVPRFHFWVFHFLFFSFSFISNIKLTLSCFQTHCSYYNNRLFLFKSKIYCFVCYVFWYNHFRREEDFKSQTKWMKRLCVTENAVAGYWLNDYFEDMCGWFDELQINFVWLIGFLELSLRWIYMRNTIITEHKSE